MKALSTNINISLPFLICLVEINAIKSACVLLVKGHVFAIFLWSNPSKVFNRIVSYIVIYVINNKIGRSVKERVYNSVHQVTVRFPVKANPDDKVALRCRRFAFFSAIACIPTSICACVSRFKLMEQLPTFVSESGTNEKLC